MSIWQKCAHGKAYLRKRPIAGILWCEGQPTLAPQGGYKGRTRIVYSLLCTWWGISQFLMLGQGGAPVLYCDCCVGLWSIVAVSFVLAIVSYCAEGACAYCASHSSLGWVMERPVHSLPLSCTGQLAPCSGSLSLQYAALFKSFKPTLIPPCSSSIRGTEHKSTQPLMWPDCSLSRKIPTGLLLPLPGASGSGKLQCLESAEWMSLHRRDQFSICWR